MRSAVVVSSGVLLHMMYTRDV